MAQSMPIKGQSRQWRMLYIYNIYRLVSIFSLFIAFWINSSGHFTTYNYYYAAALFFYFIFGIAFLNLCRTRAIKFEHQVLWSGTIDVILMVLFIHAIGYIQSGLGIILIASIAMLSILVPGRLAVFFAAIASCMFLGIGIAQYLGSNEMNDLGSFFSTGVYGAGFFGTALTAWYLASWVRSSESLAKLQARELASMQRLNEYIVERLQHGVLFINNGRIKLINSSACQFFKVPESKKALSLKELSKELYLQYRKFFSTTPHEAVQTTIEHPPLQVHFFPAEYAGDSAVVILLEDMTDLSQQAQQLKLASLGRFSASIAHELRNPLGVISHAIQLLGEGEDLHDEDKRLKELIVNNCQRMDRVIKNVLQISRRQQSKPEPIEMNSFLQQFLHDYCLTNQCIINLNIPAKNEHLVFDKSQLEQIFVILCDNVMQHGRNKEDIAVITISVIQEKKKFIIKICDEGPGVPEKIRNSIFDPFFSTVRTGNGMGLFIAKELCEINQARLSLEDTPIGCCFLITSKQIKEI
ncbi:two-component system sensor kinase PilS (plasmid) [Legionella adelaidensis]|uniref:histidine kinase n=1 Tax=Legionella adelaidensis TaxID=45056 RepID=A0A0W0R417_9GAMM|nr:HAMP domain-containing sensor histidine kinase [Legionella adelaidensis]KTC65814.1 sensor protein PilS [Legionella adelaidensis]VEH85242.1 two-component system sensor kinase PilS [Legionella adelaidensis]